LSFHWKWNAGISNIIPSLGITTLKVERGRNDYLYQAQPKQFPDYIPVTSSGKRDMDRDSWDI
jgi:hypothetical protein